MLLPATPEGDVAAFERADVLELDPMAEIIGTGVDPERALADFAFAVQVVRRAGTPSSWAPGRGSWRRTWTRVNSTPRHAPVARSLSSSWPLRGAIRLASGP